jgi:uncharacterized cupredoxin-like copper-binding protein
VKLLKADAWFPDTRVVEGHENRRVTRRAGHWTGPLLIALCALLVAPSAFAAAAGGPARIDVTLRDFKIKLSRHSVPAGPVDIHVHNGGPSTHEINVDRTNLDGGSLPIKGDGLTVDEDSKSLLRIDSIEQLNLGESGDLHLNLRPGHYVLYCNLEGHYLGGMHASFDVRPDGK